MHKILLSVFLSLILHTVFAQDMKNLEKCKELILKGVEELNQKNHIKSLEYLIEVKGLAQEFNYHEQVFLALNNIGSNYYMMLDYGEALDHYLEAYTIALKELSPAQEMIALNNIAILYSKEKKFSQAETFFEKACEIALKNQDSLKIGIYSVNLAYLSLTKNELEKAENHIKTAQNHLINHPSINNYTEAAVIDYLFLKGEYELMKIHASKLLPKISTPRYSEERLQIKLLLSKVYQEEGNWKKAISETSKLLQDSLINYEQKIEVYDLLTELYAKHDSPYLSLAYKDSLLMAKDSIQNTKNGKLFENSRIKFEIENYKHELFISEEKIKSERTLFSITLICVFLVLCSALWVTKNYISKQKQKKILAENQQKITILELGKQTSEKLLLEQKIKEREAIIQLEQEQLKNEIEQKNRQLTTKALALSSRNEMLQEIVNSLKLNLTIDNVKQINKLIQELENHLDNQNDWDDFFAHFEEVNRGFLDTIKSKHSSLNLNDIRFLAYLYMNLSLKEISTLLNITIEACRKRKERIMKKLNIENDISLYDYIRDI